MKFLLKQNKRSAVSPVIATLLLIAIAVAAAIIVYAFVTGLIGGLSSGASSNLITATGSLTIPSGSGAATLIVSLTNNAASPITAISISYPQTPVAQAMADSAFPATVLCMGETQGGLACTVAAPALANAQCGETVSPLASKSVPFCTLVAGVNTMITTGNPLPVSSETSAVDSVGSTGATPLTTGTSYAFTVTVVFANGATHIQALTLTGQI